LVRWVKSSSNNVIIVVMSSTIKYPVYLYKVDEMSDKEQTNKDDIRLLVYIEPIGINDINDLPDLSVYKRCLRDYSLRGCTVGKDTFQVTALKNHLVFSEIYKEDSYHIECPFLEGANFMTLELLRRERILCRGAIVKGKLYHKGNEIKGDAYNRAYKIAHKEANEHPRILLDEDITEVMKALTQMGFPEHANIFEQDDEDGRYFINYLFRRKPNCPERVINSALWSARYNISSLIESVKGGALNIQSEIEWLVKYFNKSLEEYGNKVLTRSKENNYKKTTETIEPISLPYNWD